jgi:hypothetical protein
MPQPWLATTSLSSFGVGGVLIGWAIGGFNSARGFNGAVIGGIVGCIVGALVWAASLFYERSKNKNEKV